MNEDDEHIPVMNDDDEHIPQRTRRRRRPNRRRSIAKTQFFNNTRTIGLQTK